MNTTGDTTKTTFMKEVEAHKVREEFEVEPLYQTLDFDGALVTSNDFDMEINGVAITQIPFNVNNNDTMDDIAAEIAGFAEIQSAVRVGTDQIKIVPVPNYGADDFGKGGQDFADLDNYIVTSGAGQAVATVDKVDSQVRPGMPVELDPATGKVIPLTNDANLEYIGISLHNSKGGELVTVALRAYAVIFAEVSASLDFGPVTWDSYTESTGYNRYNQSAVTTANFQGWALDDADTEGDIIRVAVRN